MVNGISASDTCGFNEERGSKFCWLPSSTIIYRLKAHRPKRCEYNNKDKDNSSKTLND